MPRQTLPTSHTTPRRVAAANVGAPATGPGRVVAGGTRLWLALHGRARVVRLVMHELPNGRRELVAEVATDKGGLIELSRAYCRTRVVAAGEA